MIGFDEMLEKGNDELSIFTDDGDIFRWLYGDGLIGIASFVEPYGDFSINVVAYRHLALAPVTFSFSLARNELFQSQLLNLLSLLYPSCHLIVSEKLSVVVLYHSVYIFDFILYLLLVG